MTKLTSEQAKQVDQRIVEGIQESFNKIQQFKNEVVIEFKEVHGRIKSLEETIARLERIIESQKNNIAEQVSEIEKLKEMEPQEQDSNNVWKLLESNPVVKSGIMGMVSVERNKIAQKEKNLVIFGVGSSDDKEKIKNDVLDILDVIGMKNLGKRAKINRHRTDGPVTIELESVEAKMRIMRVARELRSKENYKNVYINMDLTRVELERSKDLRKQQFQRNDELTLGTGRTKYGMHKFEESVESEFYWGIRRDELVRIRRRK